MDYVGNCDVEDVDKDDVMTETLWLMMWNMSTYKNNNLLKEQNLENELTFILLLIIFQVANLAASAMLRSSSWWHLRLEFREKL